MTLSRSGLVPIGDGSFFSGSQARIDSTRMIVVGTNNFDSDWEAFIVTSNGPAVNPSVGAGTVINTTGTVTDGVGVVRSGANRAAVLYMKEVSGPTYEIRCADLSIDGTTITVEGDSLLETYNENVGVNMEYISSNKYIGVVNQRIGVPTHRQYGFVISQTGSSFTQHTKTEFSTTLGENTTPDVIMLTTSRGIAKLPAIGGENIVLFSVTGTSVSVIDSEQVPSGSSSFNQPPSIIRLSSTKAACSYRPSRLITAQDNGFLTLGTSLSTSETSHIELGALVSNKFLVGFQNGEFMEFYTESGGVLTASGEQVTVYETGAHPLQPTKINHGEWLVMRANRVFSVGESSPPDPDPPDPTDPYFEPMQFYYQKGLPLVARANLNITDMQIGGMVRDQDNNVYVGTSQAADLVKVEKSTPSNDHASFEDLTDDLASTTTIVALEDV